VAKDPLNKDEWTPLHVAARFEQKEAVSYLLSAAAEKEAKDAMGQTALHIACRHGLLDMARHLLNHRLEVCVRTYACMHSFCIVWVCVCVMCIYRHGVMDMARPLLKHRLESCACMYVCMHVCIRSVL
jgi:hypothetical protein